jgi:O-antigen ligase
MTDDMRTGMAGITAFVLSLVFAVASGLLIAPLVSAMALVAFPVRRSDWSFDELPMVLVPAGLFLAWVGLSYLWSPFDDLWRLPKTLIGIPLYVLFVLRVGSLRGPWKRHVEAALLFCVLALGLFLVGESITDGAGTRSFWIAEEDVSLLNQRSLDDKINRNLGHATAPLVLMAMPAALMTWREGGPIIGICIMVLTGWAAFSFGTDVNAAAFLIGGIAAAITYYAPRTSIAVIFGVVAGAFLIIPPILPGLIAALPADFVQSLPLNWTSRLEIWSFAGDLVQQKMWFGHGLEASRFFDDTTMIAGYEFALMPLHPHNAALQIWLETGLIGTMLLAVAIISAGGQVASAPKLTRNQAVAAAWVLTTYVSLIIFSYGVWQEWHQGVVAIAATAAFLVRGSRSNG